MEKPGRIVQGREHADKARFDPPGLVGQCDERCPLRRTGTGAADGAPDGLAIVIAVIHVKAGVGIAVVRDVGDRSLGAAEGDAALISGFGFILADAAAAAAPTRIQMSSFPSGFRKSDDPPTPTTLGEAAGHSTPLPSSPEDAKNETGVWPAGVAKWLSKETSLGEFGASPAHGNRRNPGIIRSIIHRGHQIRNAAGVGLDHQNLHPGAIACAHWVSNAVSSPQPVSLCVPKDLTVRKFEASPPGDCVRWNQMY